MSYRIITMDPLLKHYEADIDLRMKCYKEKRKELLRSHESLSEFANGADYFGLHRVKGGWVYREWAPGADSLALVGDFNQWNPESHVCEWLENGIFELKISGVRSIHQGSRYRVIVRRGEESFARIPAYAKFVVQDPVDYSWCACVHEPQKAFPWKNTDFKRKKDLLIYETHVGMAEEDGKVGSYEEFIENVLPRIKRLGYTAIQLMAIQEHPYYASFGYQVTNFFAPSSRYGKPEGLKKLIDAAHGMGLAVLLDIVHSHAAPNTVEGIAEFDGTTYQYCHEGGKGQHPAWGTRLFDYGKNEVLHFLLSNVKYWMEEFHFDGFRFDGVTSMLYHDHGLGTDFMNYDAYFSLNTHIEAIVYLMLANELIHELHPKALSIAEDMSGMPGMCLPIKDGGIGFDYRLGMGVPDFWIKTLKEVPDEDWDMWKLWYEFTGRRPGEKVVGYAESHDQALVGDKTIMFRLCDKEMYWSMDKADQNLIVDRGIALHKMIRLVTLTLAGDAYLNFMGNEFGHPEWIDFPREGNQWSYHYCRRQWSLADNGYLKYEWLNDFDKDMVHLARRSHLLTKPEITNLWTHQGDKILVFERGGLIFLFNFHPTKSYQGYFIPVEEEGEYKVVFTSDEKKYGGYDRISLHETYHTETLPDGRCGFLFYIPSRTCTVLKKK